MASSFKSSRLLSIDDGAEAPRNSLLAHASATIATALGTNCNSSQLPATQPTELLTLAEVELRTKMKSSNIYRLIKLGLFPCPIKFGGAKWIAAEVEEYVQRQIEERDRERDPNNFVPRPSILSGNSMSANGARSQEKPGITPAQPASTVRMLDPQLCEALRLLKVDIPELYVDPAACNVVLAVIKVDLPSAQQVNTSSKGKKR
jgi:predicted DNA-binding transcriptional regulator AlpA